MSLHLYLALTEMAGIVTEQRSMLSAATGEKDASSLERIISESLAMDLADLLRKLRAAEQMLSEHISGYDPFTDSEIRAA